MAGPLLTRHGLSFGYSGAAADSAASTVPSRRLPQLLRISASHLIIQWKIRYLLRDFPSPQPRHSPAVKLLNPAEVTGGGRDKIVSIPWGFGAFAWPCIVCAVNPALGLDIDGADVLLLLLESPPPMEDFISVIEWRAAKGGPKKLNGNLCSNIAALLGVL